MGVLEHLMTKRSDAANSLAIPESATCYICLEGRSDDNGPLVRACACRGESGFVHMECISHFALSKEKDNMGRMDIEYEPWSTCSMCHQPYTGKFNNELARLHWEKYKHLDPTLGTHTFYKLRAALDHIGNSLLDQHRVKDALEFAQRLYDLQKSKIIDIGDGTCRFDWITPSEVSDTCNFLGGCFLKLDQLNKATKIFHEGLDYCTYRGPDLDVNMVENEAVLLNSLAEVHVKRGELAEAVKLRRMMLRIRERGGKNNYSYIQGAFSLGCVLISHGKKDEGVELVTESKKIAQKVLGPLHHHVMKSDHLLESLESENLFSIYHSGRLGPNMAKIFGLKSRKDLNGKMVEVSSYNQEEGRYKTILSKDNGQTEVIGIKPNNIILQKGVKVVIRGLVSANHLNGKEGEVVTFRNSARYAVRLCDGSGKDIAVKAENAIAY